MTARLAVTAPAKINLWLRVFGRDAKGYHAIESLFQLISIADELVVERTASGVTLAGAPEALGPVDENLIVRAARGFLRAAGASGGVAIMLSKRIPWNAGLGGASSDAAATLLAMNRLHADRLTPGDLIELGASLGSDVPFFLTGAPLALGWGRGERLLGLPPLPALPLLIVPPPAPVKTAEAYAWIDKDRAAEHTGEFAAVVPANALGSWEEVRRRSHNDFEPVVAGRLPQIGHWLDRLRETDAFLVRLAGSGGAMVALYETAPARDAAWRRLGADERMLRGETLTAAPEMRLEN
ncbi:MAG: 4-(cytidine 5'-diphospho)-2-C-methyl-D-erythritol kinase [Gemmatimonadales bacterium]|nr:4-(cytidine 5'-diphospho)-2-C-methyl-D-erythritol kinase [Gemmatimonadales bacterium]